MTVKLPSASAVTRGMACPASQALPHVYSPPGRAADRGNAVHTLMDHTTDKGHAAALQMVPPEFREWCARIDSEAIIAATVGDGELIGSEITYVFDYVTGKSRELGRRLNRNYRRKAPTEFAMTIDLGVKYPSRVKSTDWKTGSYVEPAADNSQLKLHLVAMTDVFSSDIGTGELVKIGDEGVDWTDSADYDAFDRDAFVAEIGEMVVGIEKAEAVVKSGGTPAVREGDHCKFCPAYERCPAKLSLLIAIVGGKLESLEDENAVLAYQRTRDVIEIGERALNKIKERADREPIALGDGWYYGRYNGRYVRHRRGA